MIQLHLGVSQCLQRRTPRALLRCASELRSPPLQLEGLAWPSDAFQARVTPTALAFVGDAVWTLHVRSHCLTPPKHISLYHAGVRKHVTAEAQAEHHDRLVASGLLSTEEQALLTWARDYGGMTFRTRFDAAAQATYRKATALEALVGYLHYKDPTRLSMLIEKLLNSL